ncbi:MAG: hypothetical protein AAF927_01640 [Bacteroidota bacterium]
MNKTKIALISIGSFILLAALVLLAYWYGEKKGYDFAWLEIEEEDEAIATTDPVENLRIEIGLGSRGEGVLAFQQYYNQNRPGFTPSIKEDGVFGEETRAAADVFGLPEYFAI